MRASSKKYKYSILYSAKSGCTMLRKLFLFLHQHELDHEVLTEWHNLHHDFPFEPNFDKVIALSRDPYSRAVSSFTSKLCGRGGHNPLGRLDKDIKLKEVTFKNFLLHLYERKGEIDKINNHVATQSKSLRNLKGQKIIKVKLENFNEDIIKAYEDFDLNDLIGGVKKFIGEMGYINKTERNDEEVFCGETIYQLNQKIFPKYQHFYNDELRELVRKIYQEDFENFNYV